MKNMTVIMAGPCVSEVEIDSFKTQLPDAFKNEEVMIVRSVERMPETLITAQVKTMKKRGLDMINRK